DREVQEFVVHQEMLTKRSEFSRRAMNGNWAATDTRVITLDDIEPLNFQIYANLVYTNLIAIDQEDEEYLDTWAGVFVVAERLQDVQAKIIFVAAFHKKFTVPDSRIVTEVYEGTVKGNKMRRYMVDLYCAKSPKRLKAYFEEDDPDYYCHDFLFGLILAARSPVNAKRKWKVHDVQEYMESIEQPAQLSDQTQEHPGQ
ncbi:hypothetical protein M011DRAFT_393993, partial [Sporormia fimetaria CBS 119925]